MATITLSTGSGAYKYQFRITYTYTQSTENNSTTINVSKVEFQTGGNYAGGSSSTNATYFGTLRIKFGGSSGTTILSRSTASAYVVNSNTWYTMTNATASTHSGTVAHNADGTKSGTFYISTTLSGGAMGNSSSTSATSSSITLPTIEHEEEEEYYEEGVVSMITMLSGTTYNIKDEAARNSIASIQALTDGEMIFLGYSSTAITDGSSTNPISIGGVNVTAVHGNVVLYGDKEFIFHEDDDKWHEFGSYGDIGDLGYKATASASYTPGGSVTKPTFSGTQATISTDFTIAGSVAISTGSGTANYTPAGTIGTPTITVTPSTEKIYGLSSAGSQDSLTTTVSGETMTLAFTAGSAPTRTAEQTVMKGISSASSTQPSWTGTGTKLNASFTGTQVTGSATYTPAGTITQPSFTGTQATITVS